MPKWSPQRQITESDIRTSKAPALAVFGDKLYMVWRGRSSDNLWYSVFDDERRQWGENRRVPNNYTSVAPTLAEFEGRLYLSYRGKSSDTLYYCTMDAAEEWSEPVKLNDLGITKFAQVAAFTKDDIEKVDDALSFKGRIERDDWVSQAAELAKDA